MSSTRTCLATLNNPLQHSGYTPLQYVGDYALTGISSYALTELFMCFLHCVGASRVANNVSFQMISLMVIDVLQRAMRELCRSKNPMSRIIIEPEERLITDTTQPDVQQNCNEIRATLLFNFMGAVVGVFCGIVFSEGLATPSESMLHVNRLVAALTLSIALAGKFAGWDLQQDNQLSSCPGFFNRLFARKEKPHDPIFEDDEDDDEVAYTL